jgi:hypothetical protein
VGRSFSSAAEEESRTPASSGPNLACNGRHKSTRPGNLEQSLAGVDASLKPVAAIARPAALRELILLAAACGAGLIVLHALLRRRSNRAVAPAARKE